MLHICSALICNPSAVYFVHINAQNQTAVLVWLCTGWTCAGRMLILSITSLQMTMIVNSESWDEHMAFMSRVTAPGSKSKTILLRLSTEWSNGEGSAKVCKCVTSSCHSSYLFTDIQRAGEVWAMLCNVFIYSIFTVEIMFFHVNSITFIICHLFFYELK